MNELDNLPKVEIKADLTNVTEKIYTNTLEKPLKSTSNITTTVLDFFYNTIMYPMQKYNLYAQNKLENYAEDLQNRAKKIPEKNLVHPRVNILGPAMEGLKYNLDEKYIKEMFTNILLSDMDNRRQSKVLPAYIEVVKQLSEEDAIFLKKLFLTKSNSFPLVELRGINPETNTFKKQFECISLKNNSIELLKLPSLIVDNLERLKIVSLTYGSRLIFKYDDLISAAKKTINESTIPPDTILDGEKGIFEFTSFGKDFIDICLS